MRIGELARRAGISQRALRYYEEQGLLRPARRPSGYRAFAEADVHRVRRIRTLLAAGIGTAIISEVLPCMVDEGEILAPACPELIPELTRERDRMSRAIEELHAARTILDAIIAAPPTPEAVETACPPADPPPVTAEVPAATSTRTWS